MEIFGSLYSRIFILEMVSFHNAPPNGLSLKKSSPKWVRSKEGPENYLSYEWHLGYREARFCRSQW